MSGNPGAGSDALPERSDVVVIGGGIAGTSTLHHLVRNGIDATLIERGEVGRGATEAAVGVLSPPMRQPFHQTAHHRGLEQAREIWAFALRSVAGLGEALAELGATDEAGLDLRGGHVLAESHSQHEVRLCFEALSEAGFSVRWMSSDEVRTCCGGRGFTGGFLLEGGGAISPGSTARVLARAARERGGRVVEGVRVTKVARDADGLSCLTSQGPIAAKMVVYATHVDSRRFSSLVGDEIVPIQGQGMKLQVEGIPPQEGCFATHWKLNVWRQAPDGTLYLGGWRHDAWDRAYWKSQGEIDDRLQQDVERWYRGIYPDARITVLERWSGVFGWTSDYLPLVGPLPGAADEMVISGFSGGGLPFAFESGRILADAIAGKDPVPGASLFNPRRFL